MHKGSQALNMNEQLSSGARGLNFRLSIHLHPYLYESSEVPKSDALTHMSRSSEQLFMENRVVKRTKLNTFYY